MLAQVWISRHGLGMRFALFAYALTLCACTQFPDLDNAISGDAKGADFPALVPLEPILAARRAPPATAQEAAGDVLARLSGLQARAARLRSGVLSPSDRARLRQTPGR